MKNIRNEEQILRRLIETVIMPQYPQILGIYELTHQHSNLGSIVYYLILEMKEPKNTKGIEIEILKLFKMVGLHHPDIGTQSHKSGLNNILHLDFKFL